jgi:hypothetical protein
VEIKNFDINVSNEGVGYYKLAQVPLTSNYFSMNTYGLNHIGFGFPDGTYRLIFRREIYGWDAFTYKTVKDALEFKNRRTTMADVEFTRGERAILGAVNYKKTVQDKKRTPGVETYSIDSSINEMVFMLNPETGSLENHNMRLITPGGIQIDPAYAQNHVDMDFQENIADGFAFFYVNNPEPGQWQLTYNPALTVKSAAPVIGDLDVQAVIPDAEYDIDDTVPVEVLIPGQTACASPAISATLYFSSNDGETWANAGAVALAPKLEGTGYDGFFKPSGKGVYRVAVSFECAVQSETVTRETEAVIRADDYAGDVDHSGTIDLADAIYSLMVSSGNAPDGFYSNADVNSDGRIGLPEAIFALETVVKLR